MRALIVGVSGQDGSLLANHLLNEGYEVIGTSRDAARGDISNLVELGIKDKLTLTSMAPTDFRSVLSTIREYQPTKIFNLSGQSSVGLSFGQPVETLDSIVGTTVNILECLRFERLDARFYNASSSECFGNTRGKAATELTPFTPRSPYAVAKAAAHWQVEVYREAYGLFACSGILFNHESPLRAQRFVTQKICTGAAKVSLGMSDGLELGDLSVVRDWGWAPEYVVAMTKMLDLSAPQSFVIATGESHTLEQFADLAFQHVGLDYKRCVTTGKRFLRPADIQESRGDPSFAKDRLGWQAKVSLREIAANMVDSALRRLRDQDMERH
ncbi:MAG: GDP-mannose 4,6-dehydratase [Myxococcota bacterium]